MKTIPLAPAIAFRDKTNESHSKLRGIDAIERIAHTRLLNAKKGDQSAMSFIDTIRDIRILSFEDEHELVIKAKKGDLRARNVLILSNLKLVASIAKRYDECGLPMIDLMQEGSIGLMNAVQKYDPKKGVRFSTYAAWWIREGITRALSNKSRIVRLPGHIIELMTKIRRVRSQLSLRTGREACTLEIAEELNESLAKVEHALISSQPCLSLDQKVSTAEDEDYTIHNTIMDEDSENSVISIDDPYLRAQIDCLLDVLSDHERKVVQLRFGLGSGQEKNIREISKEIGLTRYQVGKLSCLAMRKLKKVARIEAFDGYFS